MTAAVTAVPSPVSGYEGQFDDYVEMASFLWFLHERAQSQPHYYARDLVELENRLDGQFRAMAQAPDEAWRACSEALNSNDPGSVFVAAVIAFRSRCASRIQNVVDIGVSTSTGVDALVSALGWLPDRYVHDWLRRFLSSKDFLHKRLALAACRTRAEDPCNFLTRILRRDDCRANSRLHAEALKCVGVFKRHDLSLFLLEAHESNNHRCRFESIRATILLGENVAAKRLASLALNVGAGQRPALMLAVRSLSRLDARRWISHVAQQSHEGARLAIQAAGAYGDPEIIPWLLSCMKHLSLARVAGEAFAQITGFDLEEHELNHRLPSTSASAADDDPDSAIPPLDHDEYLPWPHTEKLSAFWETIKHRFPSGQRHLRGAPLSIECCQQVLETGPQRARLSASLEWALQDRPQFWVPKRWQRRSSLQSHPGEPGAWPTSPNRTY
ncbi:TIGR02270 family protein [Marinimicrobium sp. ARAG 43.8]|uniref:TIGR02270 family protein n=1 Tax=Marinimicrobium sp. ARAG 43.8 TaxID=3418719 RepID=UPI003CEEACB1